MLRMLCLLVVISGTFEPLRAQAGADGSKGERAPGLSLDVRPAFADSLRLRAIDQMQKMIRSQQGGGAGTQLDWTQIGPQPVYFSPVQTWSGRVDALAVDPRNSDVAFLGSQTGGIWKTTSGGRAWTAVGDQLASMNIRSIVIDPSRPDTIYVGTRDAGILKSVDNGTTWQNIREPFVGISGPYSPAADIRAIAIQPVNSNVLLAALAFEAKNGPGIVRSTDGGMTWKSVLSGGSNGSGAFGLQVFFASSTLAYAALGNWTVNSQSGVYRSIDAGLTWSIVNGQGGATLPMGSCGLLQIAGDPHDSRVVYAGLADADSSGSLGIFVTRDSGSTWEKLDALPDYCHPQCWTNNVIAVDPADSQSIVVGGRDYLWRSLDLGSTWRQVSAPGSNGLYIHGDFHALAFSRQGDRLYVGSDGGAWNSDDPLAEPLPAWRQLNTTLAITQFWPGIAMDSTNRSIGYGGSQDNGAIRMRGQLQGEQTLGCDCGFMVLDPTNSNVVYTSLGTSVSKSTDGGLTWSDVSTGIDVSDRRQIPAPLVGDPKDQSVLYFGTQRLYQTRNAGRTWQPVSEDLAIEERGLDGTNGTISSIEVSRENPDLIWLGTTTGYVYNTVNGHDTVNVTWTNRAKGLPSRAVTRVAIDPGNSAIVYAVFSGYSFNQDKQGHIFRSSNAGQTWADISGNLPNVQGTDLAIDSDLPGHLYLATEIGVFQTVDLGTTWSVLGMSLPRVYVTSLALHRASRTLRASTFGRSMWEIYVPVAAPILSSITNGGSFESAAAIAPGECVTLFGSSLGPPATVTARIETATGRLATMLGEVQVLFNGVAAPLVYVSANQIGAFVPYDVAGRSPTSVTVQYKGLTTSSLTVSIIDAAPALFTADSSGTGPAAALNSDGSYNSADRPAAPGSIVVLYGTGEGQTSPAGIDGQLAETVFPKPILPVEVTIDGQAAPLLYAGAAPGLSAGMIQVNVQVPPSTGSGKIPIALSIGGVRSRTGVVIFVE